MNYFAEKLVYMGGLLAGMIAAKHFDNYRVLLVVGFYVIVSELVNIRMKL